MLHCSKTFTIMLEKSPIMLSKLTVMLNDRFVFITRFRVSSDLMGAFNRSRSDGSLPVLVAPACVLSLSVSDTLEDPPPPLVPGSHDVDAILKRGQHSNTR